MRGSHRFTILAIGLIALIGSHVADASIVISIIGDKAKADISLPGPGATTYDSDFELQFDNPLNLSVACLGLDADVLDAGEIAAITARLPDPVNMVIDPAFPVRVTVEPPAGCGLAFDNEVDVQWRSINLIWSAGSPYRLMKAPVSGAFRDITGEVSAGSVRVRGSTGGFSEFVFIKDLNPDYTPEATALYTQLNARLADPALSATVKAVLQMDANLSRAAFLAGNYGAAIAVLADFDQHAADLVGDETLPNRWRSQRDLIDHEGELISLSDALKFTLGRLNGAP
ncbi:MAG: hypothetical protein JNN30_06645 [Rhodanobacteraceae bacterium]|nr:hypothetical protein [Rhodanobacteraceae bacterium]